MYLIEWNRCGKLPYKGFIKTENLYSIYYTTQPNFIVEIMYTIGDKKETLSLYFPKIQDVLDYVNEGFDSLAFALKDNLTSITPNSFIIKIPFSKDLDDYIQVTYKGAKVI